MSITRIWLAGLAVLSFANQTQAQSSIAVEPPVLKVGDRWTWTVRISTRDNCTNSFPSGAQTTHAVTAAGEDGYVLDISGPQPEFKEQRRLAKDLSFDAELNGKQFKSIPVRFPLQAATTWETTLVSGPVVSTLKCQAEGNERSKVGTEEVDVVPIVCKGNWRNTAFNASDVVTYKYWYAPSIGNFVRRTVFSYYQGRTCADLDFRLESFQRGG